MRQVAIFTGASLPKWYKISTTGIPLCIMAEDLPIVFQKFSLLSHQVL
jgi:hypothetical protein